MSVGGHVFVALNNSVQISADAWCLTGSAWWEDEALADGGNASDVEFQN